MSRFSRCEEGSCEFISRVNTREPLLKRSEDELRYGRLWAEVELPKLLACKELKKEDNKLPQFRINEQ
jgi:hypothetical protein